MPIIAVPSFEDIYREKPPEILSLIKDIPSKVVIGFLCLINAEINLSKRNSLSQVKILGLFTRRFTGEQKNIVNKGIYPFLKSEGGDITIFALRYTLEFINFELLNFRDFEIDDTSPDQEYRLLKAYFIIVGAVNSKLDKHFQKNAKYNNEFFYESLNWPLIIDQLDLSIKSDIFYQVSKAFTFLKTLENDPRKQKYLTCYLDLYGRKDLWNFVFDFLRIVSLSFEETKNNEFKNSAITQFGEFRPFLDFLTIDHRDFKSDLGKQIDYKGFRETPLFKFSDERYLVINWNFLYNRIYMGLIFDFYKRSGISVELSFPEFRSYIGQNVSENILFKKIIKGAFQSKSHTLEFDENGLDNNPDCYLRIGKYIYLFELKDSLMPSELITKGDFESIKKEIDKKFINSDRGKKKGVKQLLGSIQTLNEAAFPFDQYEKKGIKKRNLIVYPIIIYTHHMYSLPGINNYLNKIFKKELAEYTKEKPIRLGTVSNLTFIDFEFFHNNFYKFQKGQLKLNDLINNYHRITKARLERQKKLLIQELR